MTGRVLQLTDISTAERIALLPEEDRTKLLSTLLRGELAALRYAWPFWARPSQRSPAWDWRTWLFMAGRGAGKTRSAAEWIRSEVTAGAQRLALVGPTAADVRDVMVLGESGLLAVFPPAERPVYEPTKRRVTFRTGAVAICLSGEEPDRPRGFQFERIWADEIASWRYLEDMWSNLLLALRLGQTPRIMATTTPKPVQLLRDLLGQEGRTVAVTRSSTLANRAHLPAAYVSQIVAQWKGTRLYEQEVEGRLLDLAGSLFRSAWIKHVDRPPALRRIIVAVDPAISRRHDETGIVVVGLGVDGRGYVLEDLSGRFTPDEWARIAISARKRHNAEHILIETNRGGDLIAATLRTADRNVAIREVRSFKGKGVRAEPVAALYEQGRVSHVGKLAALEEQLVTFDPRLVEAKKAQSPDRLDAAVHGLTALLVKPSEAPTFHVVPNLVNHRTRT